MNNLISKKNNFTVQHIAGLDSIRFFSFLSVYLYHKFPAIFHYGYLGVDVFFILSSFLLSYLALNEIKLTGSFSRKLFFVRRTLRIWPLYFAIIIFCFFVLPCFKDFFSIELSLPKNKIMWFLFLGNYDSYNYIFALKFLWSIAVEEQFYLFFLVLSFGFKKYFKFIPFILILFFIIYSFIVINFSISYYEKMAYYFINFSMGIMLAYITFYKKWNFNKIFLSIFLIASLSIILIDRIYFNDFFYKSILIYCFTCSIAAIIYCFIKLKLQKLIFFKLTEYLGKYTYGLYIFHGFILSFPLLKKLKLNPVLEVSIDLCLIFLIAFISYQLFEKHFLKLKPRNQKAA
ncbi:MAG: acyltransferase [Chitinophagaceae bacterium]|nr:acyltransferase [Chitinophagaceae bacterium]